MRPNPPRMVTVALAIALTMVGLALVFYQGPAIELVRGLGLPDDVQSQVVSMMAEQVVAWAALAASPIALIIGSLVRDV